MTREEVIKILKRGSNCQNNCEYCDKCTEVEYKQALDIAIEVLAQEPIIDKIRAEITNNIHKCNNPAMAFGMHHTLDIIDKYKKKVR